MQKIFKKPRILTTQVEEEHAKYIEELAYENHASVSEQIRNILIEYIEDHEGSFW